MRSMAKTAGPAGTLGTTSLRARAGKVASAGMSSGAVMGLRYWLYRPALVKAGERLPLLVMLHGCNQDAMALAASTRMNRIAARNRFLVLYPEQNPLVNLHRCWHWYDTRSGRAQGEARAIMGAIEQVCRRQPVDPQRIAVAGLSAGAGMAAVLAMLDPQRFRAVVMHSGVAPGSAESLPGALRAMGGAHTDAAPLRKGRELPPLLVIHGDRDQVVSLGNAAEAARWWAAHTDARPVASRQIARGKRYVATATDYRATGKLRSSLWVIHGLGHAWSGGAAGQPFSDPKGPDASRLIWAFVARQFQDSE